MKKLPHVVKYNLKNQQYQHSCLSLTIFVHILVNLYHLYQIYVPIFHPLAQIQHYVKQFYLFYTVNTYLSIYNLTNIPQYPYDPNNMTLIMPYDLALISDLYYNLFYIDNQLFIYLLVYMPNRKVFYFVFIDVKYLLLFIILNILLLIDSLLELHRISVFVFIHLLLTNLYQNFIIIYTFLNLYLDMLDVNILPMSFAYYLKMMLILFLHLFVIII